MTNDNLFDNAPIIDRYTRKQAVEDGVLVDVSEWASAGPKGMLGGYLIPVAVTRAVWEQILAIPDQYKGIQDVRGRAHDVLWMSLLASKRIMGRLGDGDADMLPVSGLYQVTLHIKGSRKRLQTYKLVLSLGDDGEPVITIMLPDED